MASHSTHAAAQRAILRVKIHLAPNAQARLPTAFRERRVGRNAWAPARALADLLKPLPTEMLRWWEAQPTGHVLIGGRLSAYRPGPVQVKNRTLVNVAHVAPVDIAENRAAVWAALAGLFDHLLGCAGAPEGTWLSEGGGVSPEWQVVGRRIIELFQLGYAPGEASRSPRAYFAWGIALYCTSRRDLNVVDPLLERLLHTTVLSASFWKRASPK
ncbi:MAG: hypothetical protein J7M34_11200 [Anaerolineae bacterium]|nr:hypothetical protein [Anaerolineae bacterium]